MPISCPKCLQFSQTQKLSEIHETHQMMGVFSPLSDIAEPPKSTDPGLTQAVGILLALFGISLTILSLGGFLPGSWSAQIREVMIGGSFLVGGFLLWQHGQKVRQLHQRQLEQWHLNWYCHRCVITFIPVPQSIRRAA